MKAIFVLSFLVAGALAHPLVGEEEITEFGIQNRIAGGKIAKENQFPYQAGLRMVKVQDGEVYRSWCGGVLISDKVVLTAAHCLDNAVSAIVYLGAHDRTAISELNREMIQVKKDKFFIHENYNSNTIEQDIALIVLPEKVKLNKYIRPVNLPKSSDTNLVGRKAVASGWGKMGDTQPSSDLLRFVNRNILDNKECVKVFGPIPSSQICMEGTGGKSTCQGDSGGPLVVEESDGTKTLVGLTSFGGISCEKGYPIVFTRVSSYLDWIAKHSDIKN